MKKEGNQACVVSWKSIRKDYTEQTVIPVTMLPIGKGRSTLTTIRLRKGNDIGDQDRGSFGRVLKTKDSKEWI